MGWLVRMVLYISLITFPIQIFLLLRITTALYKVANISRLKSRLIGIAILAWIYSLPVLYLLAYFSGNSDNLFVYGDVLTWQDYVFHYPFWIGIIILMEIFPFFILLDLLLLTSKMLFKNSPEKISRAINFLKLGVALFFIIYVPVKSNLDTNSINLKTYQINIPGLDPELHNLSIGFLADLQIDRFFDQQKTEKFENLYKNLDSDMMLYAGDVVTSGKTYITEAVKNLSTKMFPYGNIACLGDHDYWADPVAVENDLVKNNWLFLKDEHRIITYKNKKILITGITHIYSKRISYVQAKNLLANAPDADLKILLVHQPAEFLVELAEASGYDLFLAGHTHGGQIVGHIFGIPITPSRFETHYFRGYYTFKDMQIIVTNGIGLSLAPLRYHAPAEIVKIALSSTNF